jgi:hypothetical protein
MSLRQLQPLSRGQISDEVLVAAERDLATVMYDAPPEANDARE